MPPSASVANRGELPPTLLSPSSTVVMADGAIHDPRETVLMLGMVEVLTSLVAARDQYTSRHSREVDTLAMRIAVARGLTTSEAQTPFSANRGC